MENDKMSCVNEVKIASYFAMKKSGCLSLSLALGPN